MPSPEYDTSFICRTAYRIAWSGFKAFPDLTASDWDMAPRKIQKCIEVQVQMGVRDPRRIALTVLGIMRRREVEFDASSRKAINEVLGAF